MDLVGTCPKGFWAEWLAEGDCAGDPWSGVYYDWVSGHPFLRLIEPDDRFYVVAHGKLRGWAPVVRIDGCCIIRGGGAVACTIADPIPGFRGLRKRWWPREREIPFQDWMRP